jgi:hypothetical protein
MVHQDPDLSLATVVPQRDTVGASPPAPSIDGLKDREQSATVGRSSIPTAAPPAPST